MDRAGPREPRFCEIKAVLVQWAGLSQKAGQNVSFGGDFLLGLYFHVPFCHGKCPYCDFYSLPDSQSQMDQYAAAVLAALIPWREKLRGREVSTVYFGGGTPSLLGAERLRSILQGVREGFALSPGAEITLEANPTQVDRAFFQGARQAGFQPAVQGPARRNPGGPAPAGPGPLPPGCGPSGGKRPGRRL